MLYCSIAYYALEQKGHNTIIDIVIDCDNQFKYFFIFIGAPLIGFYTSIRYVVVANRTYFKAKLCLLCELCVINYFQVCRNNLILIRLR